MNGKRLVAGFLLVFGFVVLIAAPAVIWFYPVPDIPGGWCGSGANHDGYTVVARGTGRSHYLAACGRKGLLRRAIGCGRTIS
jgi:hypothetical protein